MRKATATRALSKGWKARPTRAGAGPPQEGRPEPRGEVRLHVVRAERLGGRDAGNPRPARRRRQAGAGERQCIQDAVAAGLRDWHPDPAVGSDQRRTWKGYGQPVSADELQGAARLEHLQSAALGIRAAVVG